MKNLFLLSLSVLACAAAVCVWSWRQTPDQHRNISVLTYNAAVASWNVRQATALASAAVAPLADPKSGLSPSMLAFVAAVRDTAQNVSTGVTAIRTTLDTTNGTIAEIGTLAGTLTSSTVEIKNGLVPGLNSANTLLQNYSDLPDRVAYANRWLWDCHEFAGCLQSQTLALLGAARHTLGSVSRASDQFPVLVDHFQVISTNVGAFTGSSAHIIGEIDKRYFSPQPLKSKIWHGIEDTLTFGTAGAAAWRAF